MEVFVGEDGIRRRRVRDAAGKLRTYKYCSGRDNTCENDAKTNGLCKGCVTGNYKDERPERVEGEIFADAEGIRCIYTGGQTKKFCNGKDNTCEKYVRADGLCAGCTSGNEKMKLDGLVLGQIVEKDGGRFKFDGKQLRRLCSGDDNTCAKYVAKAGMCNLHNNGGVRKKKGDE
jgi:hypothetical protein